VEIPTQPESSSDFSNRVATLALRDDAHLYLDTSFLMWLTKIGRTSRRQLFTWLSDKCSGRVHVPIWSAHEYIRHHVSGTILRELERVADDLGAIAGRAYANLRPFLDDPLQPGTTTSEKQQIAARGALNELQRLAETAKRWNRDYQEHAADVIGFINAHTPDKTPVFDFMSSIEALSAGRFTGRVPPGFQDRNKKEQRQNRTADDPNSGPLAGSNRWGDLIFWKELLELAEDANAKTVIILTNDRKNDWQYGGRGTEGVEADLLKIKARWQPVPCPHPMLSLEAQIAAGVDNVVLLDPAYFGILLRAIAGDSLNSFIDVAIVPDPPSGSGETVRRRELVDEHLKQREKEEAEKIVLTGRRFQDSPKLGMSATAFARALYESRGAVESDGPVANLLKDIQATINAGGSIADLFVKERLETFNNSMLVKLARELHDRCLANTVGYREAVTDLISTLTELPELTAASLYLGLVSSMYLERARNEVRLPPRSPVSGLLFERQDATYAALGIKALQRRFASLRWKPLYVVDPTRPLIDIRLDIVPDMYDEVILGSLRISGEEVLNPAQGDPSLRLAAFFVDRSSALGSEIVVRACELFMVPFDQVKHTDDFQRTFSFGPTTGFRRAHRVYIESEEATT
jgi:hypothetical protein